MLARGILGSGRTCGVSFWPFPNSSGWRWLISSVFLTRISHHKTTHASGYCGAWPGWAVSISVLPLTLAGGFFTISTTWKALWLVISINLTLLHPYFTSSLTPPRPPVHWPFLLPISHFPSCSVAQLCLTLCDPMNCSMAGFSVLHCLTKFAISLASLFLSKPSLKPMIQLYSTPTLCKYA